MYRRNCWTGSSKRLHSPWIAAWKRDLHKNDNNILSSKISHICDDLNEVIISKSKNVKHRISLRYSSDLMYGTCCIYKKQVEELYCDIFNINEESQDSKCFSMSSEDEIEAFRDGQNYDTFIDEVSVHIEDKSNEALLLEHTSPVKMISHGSIHNEITTNINEIFGNFSEEMELEEYIPENVSKRKKKINRIDRYKSFLSKYILIRYKTDEIKYPAKGIPRIDILEKKEIFLVPSILNSDKKIGNDILNNFIRNCVNNKKSSIDLHQKTCQTHEGLSNFENIDKMFDKDDVREHVLNETTENWIDDHTNKMIVSARSLNEFEDVVEIRRKYIVTPQINRNQKDRLTKNHATLFMYFPKYLCDLHLENIIISSKFNSEQLIKRRKNEIIEKPLNWRREWRDIDILKKLNTLWLEKKVVDFEDIYKISPKNKKAIMAANTLLAIIKFKMNNLVTYIKNEDGYITNIIPRPSYLKTKSKYRRFSLIQ